MYVCVWGRKVSIIPINQPLPASVSSWYVVELWETLITHRHTQTQTDTHTLTDKYTHTHTHTHYIITVNSCLAGLASTQITSLSQVFFNNVPPFSPPGLLLHKEPKGTKRNMHSPVWSPQPHYGALNTPLLLTLPRWPLTLGDMSERNQGEWTVAQGVREFEVMSEKCFWMCVYGLWRLLLSSFFYCAFECMSTVDVGLCFCVYVCIYLLYVDMNEWGHVFLWGRFSSFRGESVWPARLSLVTKCKSQLEIEFALSS